MNKLLLYTIFVICFAACHSQSGQKPLSIDEQVQLRSIETCDLDTLDLLAESYIAANNEVEAIKVFRKMGKVCRENNVFVEAIEYHNRALELAEAIDDKNEIILCLNQIGTDYRRIGAYEEATTYHYRALQRCEQYGEDASDFALKNKVMSLNGIGNIYLMLNNLDEAESAFSKALAGEMQLGSDLGMAINYANLGAVFESRKWYDSAKIYYEHSMEHNKLAKSQLGISLCHTHFGRLAEQSGDYAAALREYHAAYDIMDKTADRWHWLEACLAIIRVNIAKGDMHTAAVYLDRAEKASVEINSNDYLAMLYDMKYRYFEKKGDFRQALYSAVAAHQYHDSTLNLNNINHINNLRVLYEIEKQDLKITVLHKEKQLMIGLSIAIILVLALILTMFIYWMNQKKNLAQQRVKQLEQEKQIIATQAILEGETQERTRLAQELHDGLGGLLSSVKLNLTEMRKGVSLNEEQLEQCNTVVATLDECVTEMRRMAHHLMPATLSRLGLKSALENFCNSIPATEFNYFGNERRLDSNLEIIVYRIAQELINNSLKHSGGSHILVQIVQEPNRLSLTVQDNGKGFDTKTSTGMGLANVRTRADSFGGHLDIVSSPENGTEINIEFALL